MNKMKPLGVPMSFFRMRIGRRGWCFRRPPKPKRLSSSPLNANNYYMTKRSFAKPHYAFHVPGAPLNTTSYLIQTKELTYHHHHHQQNTTRMKNNEYWLSDSTVLDGYGSMKGLMGLSSTLSILLNKNNEETSGADDSNSPSKQVRDREDPENGRRPNSGPPPQPRLLSLRIMHRDDQIANLEEESMTMKERVSCLERELNQMKHRVKVLEVAHDDAMRSTVVMIRDCCYSCSDAVSVA